MTHTEKAISEQQEAISKLITFLKNPNVREILFTGPAGTGKTKLITDLIINNGINLDTTLFAAISNKALEILKSRFKEVLNGPTSEGRFKTISFILNRVPRFDSNGKLYFSKSNKLTNIISRVSLLIVDECSMIDDNTYKDILEFSVKKNCKILFVGDSYQCPPPSGKDSLKVFNIKNHVQLHTPFRYGEGINTIVTEVKNAIDNKTSISNLIKILKEKSEDSSFVQFYNNKQEFIEKAISHYKNNKHVSVIGYRNETVKSMSEYIRNSIITDNENQYSINDILICQSNYSSTREINNDLVVSEMYKVTDVSPFVMSISLDEDNKIINSKILVDNPFLDFEKDNHKITFIIKGFYLDLQSITNSNKTCKSVVSSKHTSKNYNIYKKLLIECEDMDNDTRGKWINLFNEMNYGYSINIYNSQGSTYDEVFIYLNDIINLKPVDLKDKYKALYTAMTRAKNKVHILLTK